MGVVYVHLPSRLGAMFYSRDTKESNEAAGTGGSPEPGT